MNFYLKITLNHTKKYKKITLNDTYVFFWLKIPGDMIHTLKTGEKGYHNINDCGTLSKAMECVTKELLLWTRVCRGLERHGY